VIGKEGALVLSSPMKNRLDLMNQACYLVEALLSSATWLSWLEQLL
jgi:hypothetical protein